MSDSSSKKRSKSNYYNLKKPKRAGLEPNLKGVLCFCNFREKDCVKEALNLLNEYLEKSDSSDCNQKPSTADSDRTSVDTNKVESSNSSDLAQKSDSASQKEWEDSEAPQNDLKSKLSHTIKKTEVDKKDLDDNAFEDELENELKALKKVSNDKNKFKILESGAKNIVFIKTLLENHVSLTLDIFKDIYETKVQKTRFLLRMVPIEQTCKVNLTDIVHNLEILMDKSFCSSETKTFAIIFNHRNNSCLDKDNLIKEVATLVTKKNPKFTVNLKNPDYSIVIEIIRSIALLAILPDYYKYKKFNLLQLCTQNQ